MTAAPTTFAEYAASKGAAPAEKSDTTALIRALLRDVTWSTLNSGSNHDAALRAFIRFALDDELITELLDLGQRTLSRPPAPVSRTAAEKA